MYRMFFLIVSFVMIGCTTNSSQSLPKNGGGVASEILMSEAQNGKGDYSFKVLNNQDELTTAIQEQTKGQFVISDTPSERVVMPKFPVGKKLVLYNLGSFRAGDHTIQEIKSIIIDGKDLVLETPDKNANNGGMEIQVLSKPWIIFSIPSDYKFSSIQLKYSK